MSDVLNQGLTRLRNLIEDASAHGIGEPNAMSLATATMDGQPSVRTVYLHSVNAEGPVFFANSQSGKGLQMQQNPRASLCFYWPVIHYQAVIDGSITILSSADSDELWRSRSRESQLGAWASDHSSPLESQRAPTEKLAQAKQEFSFEPIPRPDLWLAYQVQPARLEFWHTDWGKLRMREKFAVSDAGTWEYEKEAP